ncbi:signal peptidase I [Candidatus Nomurabacteria bacterium]|nr:signal peptidase I [Candidatus Nomurabacteria bacterium]
MNDQNDEKLEVIPIKDEPESSVAAHSESKPHQSPQTPQTQDNGPEGPSFIMKVGTFFLELIKIAVLAGITIALVRHFLFKPFYVKGASMEPTFIERDYLIIDEISYRFRQPERGEVVVFNAPLQEADGRDHYLKRVIGLPGERVKVEEDKVIIFNELHPQGLVLDEEYIKGLKTPGFLTVELGRNEYFVMGDNREASFDSRRFGPIHEDAIVGRAWVRGWPFSRFGTFEVPETLQ